MAMDARKQRILEAIVALYANGGEPVGSGLLANYFDMALSSATLRNEMAALTKLGLLEQPHTSAGRVPSAQGYRYYLDHLIDAPKASALPDADRRHIDDLFAAMDAEPEKLVPAAAPLPPPRPRPRISASPTLRLCRSGGTARRCWQSPAQAGCVPAWPASIPACPGTTPPTSRSCSTGGLRL